MRRRPDRCRLSVRALHRSASAGRRRGQSHRHAESSFCLGGKEEGSVVGLGDALDDGQAEADTCVVGVNACGAPVKRFGERRDQAWRERVAGVFHGERDIPRAGGGGDCTAPCSGRLWTMALCSRFMVNCNSRTREPTAGVTSPEVAIVTPCFSASGRSVSVASSARRDKSTGSRVKDRWSARLSRSNASVSSIARALTARRRSSSSPPSRLGSLRARREVSA